MAALRMGVRVNEHTFRIKAHSICVCCRDDTKTSVVRPFEEIDVELIVTEKKIQELLAGLLRRMSNTLECLSPTVGRPRGLPAHRSR